MAFSILGTSLETWNVHFKYMMDVPNTEPFYQQLSDLELAAVVCLVADQHCIIKTHEYLIDDLQSEIELIVARTFGLAGTSIQCTAQTTVEEFSNVILSDVSGGVDVIEVCSCAA